MFAGVVSLTAGLYKADHIFKFVSSLRDYCEFVKNSRLVACFFFRVSFLWIFEFQSQSGRTASASASRPQPPSQHEYCTTVGCRLSWLTRECAISSWCYVRSVKLVWFDLVLWWFDFGGIEKLKWVWLELVRFRVEWKHRQFHLKMNRAKVVNS